MKKINSFIILKIATLILFTTFTGCDTPSNTPVIPVTPVTPSNPTTPTTPTKSYKYTRDTCITNTTCNTYLKFK